MLMDEILMLSN